MRFGVWAMLASLMLVACSRGESSPAGGVPVALVHADDAYLAQVEAWRERRLAELRAPDGWLSYTGSGRLRPGSYRVGSAADSEIVLPGGPPRLGTLTLDDRQVRFRAAPGSEVRLRGQPVDEIALEPERADKRADRLDIGSAQFFVVRTGAVAGWRFRDARAPALARFAGIEHFPVDADWRIEAHWQPYPQPRPITLLTSIGTPLQARIPGEAVFRRDGREYRLQPVVQDDDPKLFFLFADRTSGKETYGGARYLFAGPPRDGRIVLDFNRAENPPCALTPHLVCPIAPPQNRLELAVTAGEKAYLPEH
jgi:uncharacterized protein